MGNKTGRGFQELFRLRKNLEGKPREKSLRRSQDLGGKKWKEEGLGKGHGNPWDRKNGNSFQVYFWK